MSTPVVVGQRTVFGIAGAGPLVAPLIPGAKSYIAFAWPGEHHLATPPAGFTRRNYWTAGTGGSPMNYYVANSANPGTDWVWGSYAPPAEWGMDVMVALVVIGFDREILADTWTTGTLNGTGLAVTAPADGALALTLVGITSLAKSFPLAKPTGAWTGIYAISPTPATDGSTNYYSAMGIATLALAGGASSGTASWSYAGTAPEPTVLESLNATLLFTGVTPPVELAASGGQVTMALRTAAASAMLATPTALPASGGQVATALKTGSATATLVAPSVHRYITSMSANRKHFLDQVGQPVLARMECAWFIQGRLPADWPTYLSSRQAHGFNVIEIAISAGNAYTATSEDGIPWLSGTHVINPAWLDRLGQFVDLAATYGMTCLISIAGGEVLGDSGAGVPPMTDAQATSWGTQIGSAFGARPNIVWGLGVDYNETDWAAANPKLALIQAGVKAASSVQHLWTVQNDVPSYTTENTFWISRVDFEFVYAYHAIYDLVLEAYTAGVGPALVGETNFELENNQAGPNTTAETLRRTVLWSLTRGAAGVDYGHRDIWPAAAAWKTVLETPAVTQGGAIVNYFRTLDWWKLVPDAGNTFLTAGQGTKPSSGTQDSGAPDPLESTYATAAVSADGTLGVVYVPTARAFTIDLAKLGGGRQGWRVDPASLVATPLSSVTASNAAAGTNSAGQSDWLYVFKASPITSAVAAGPRVAINGVETPVTWTVLQGGIEVPVTSWRAVLGGVEVPLV